ncbi:MAG: aldehyde dehydrogenase, partial [Alistipes sp.]
KYRNNYVQTRTLLAMTGQSFVDLGTAVALEQCAFPTALSQIAYAHYRTIAEVEAWLSAHDTELQCVVSECVSHSRCVRFGCAQAPTLTDYADEKDVIAFLVALN